MANNLANVKLSELPAALTAATNAEVSEFYLTTTRDAMQADTFHSDPYRLAARDEVRKREQAAFLALSPHERTPDAYRN